MCCCCCNEGHKYLGKLLGWPSMVEIGSPPARIPRSDVAWRFATITVAHRQENYSVRASPRMFRLLCGFPRHRSDPRRSLYGRCWRVHRDYSLVHWRLLVSHHRGHFWHTDSDSKKQLQDRITNVLQSPLRHRTSHVMYWPRMEIVSLRIPRRWSIEITYLSEPNELHTQRYLTWWLRFRQRSWSFRMMIATGPLTWQTRVTGAWRND